MFHRSRVWVSPILNASEFVAVVNITDCYLRGAGFDSRVMHGFFPHVKEVEDTDLIEKPCKRSKTCPVIPEGVALTQCSEIS
jgi:hypothetical protein